MSAETTDVTEELRELLERPGAAAGADRVDHVLQDALRSTAADEIPKPVVKASLPAVLLALLEIRDADRNGNALLEDCARAFGHRFSPGTVYPKLHALRDDDVLTVRERVETKDYAFQDPEAAYTRIERRAEQHAAMARFLHGALEARPDE